MFYRDLKPQRPGRVVLDSIIHVLRVFWTASKTFLEKRVSREFITMMLLWTLKISIREKHKHRILIRRRFYRVLKPLHVMFYRPFDRSIGLWIINEFLKSCFVQRRHYWIDLKREFGFILIPSTRIPFRSFLFEKKKRTFVQGQALVHKPSTENTVENSVEETRTIMFDVWDCGHVLEGELS